MRGSLNFAFEDGKAIDQNFHQGASDVEQKLKELQFSVSNLMIVIVNHITLNDEESTKETVAKAAEGIEELFRCGLQMESLTASDDITGFLGHSMRI